MGLRIGLNLLLVLLLVTWGPLPAGAGIISTAERVAPAEAAPALEAEAGRERLRRLLERAEVRAELERQGVPNEEARARIDSLSDAEVAALVGRLDDLPAGGDGLGAVIVIVAVVAAVLALTDYFGITDVFPWIEKRQTTRPGSR